MPALFGDGMVIQQKTDAPIWGWAAPGSSVTVQGSWGERASAVTDERGRWMASLRTPAAGGPYTLSISGETTVTFSDVLIGEVWLCSGQSNMEWSVSISDRAAETIAGATDGQIRLFTVPNTIATAPRATIDAQWQICTPQTVGSFSAVGYNFGRELRAALGVPVGLIASDWGGTPAESWVSAAGLREFPEFGPALEHLAAATDPLKRQQLQARAEEGWWSALDAKSQIPSDWASPQFTDEEWATMDLPATLGPDGLDQFDGVVYFRRVVEVPDRPEGAASLELGPIDDYDDAFVNGVHVGATHGANQWAAPRRYTLPPGTIRQGRNLIAVRMLDHSGPGGVNGQAAQMRLVIGDRTYPLAGAWRYRRGAAQRDLGAMTEIAINQNTATVLANGMIAPLVPFAMRGAIWYQGESNVGRSEQYRRLLPALVADWRRLFRNPQFQFYAVQIAPFNYGTSDDDVARLRDAQREILAQEHTGLAVITDIGDDGDIHPRNKHEVGRRLSLIARARAYGASDLEFSGPLYASHVIERGAIRVSFAHAKGLRAMGAAPGPFLIAGEDRVFHEAQARIDGEAVVVTSPAVKKPVALRFGWTKAGASDLYNAAGLPASPFRTDDWPASRP